ncbi:MAG: hypothetical protein ABJC63_08475 [Gemmatimonadales bacterium]
MAVVIAISAVLSVLTYRLIEVPIRFGDEKRRNAAMLVTSLALVAIVGLTVESGSIGPRLDG